MTADGVTATKDRAARDFLAYAKALPSIDGLSKCVAIENRWDLYGYSPQIVSEILYRISQGNRRDLSEDAALGEGWL